MRKIKMVVRLMTTIPVVFISAVLAAPFYTICYWAGEEKEFNAMGDRVAERLGVWIANG